MIYNQIVTWTAFAILAMFYFVTEYLEEQRLGRLPKQENKVFDLFTVDRKERNGIGVVRKILLRVREIQRESGSNFP